MFDDFVRTEAWSLRCATRAHECDKTQLAFPTTASVSIPYESCRARTDATCDSSQVDTSVATGCNPLERVSDLANAVKQLKGGGQEADDKILVAAIYGTPRAGDTSPPTYKIDMVPNPMPGTADAEVYDYWPICYDPDYPPTGSGFDKTAAEHGATGGLRIDAFLNEFPPRSRLAYSICEPDFGPAMAGIGKALLDKMDDLCVPFKLVDTSDEPGLQADCRVAYRIPRAVQDANGNTRVVFDESPASLPACDATRTPDCWEVRFGDPNGSAEEKDTAARCPATPSAPSQMVNVVRTPGVGMPDGTKVVMQCLTCVDPRAGMQAAAGCDY
jgi:hypothetical protein